MAKMIRGSNAGIRKAEKVKLQAGGKNTACIYKVRRHRVLHALPANPSNPRGVES